MREESHLEDMRAAIRGDFERLEERLGEQELMRTAEDAVPRAEPNQSPEQAPPQPAAEDHVEPEPPAEEPQPEPEPEPEQEPILADEADEAEDPEPEPARRSWLDKVLGR